MGKWQTLTYPEIFFEPCRDARTHVTLNQWFTPLFKKMLTSLVDSKHPTPTRVPTRVIIIYDLLGQDYKFVFSDNSPSRIYFL